MSNACNERDEGVDDDCDSDSDNDIDGVIFVEIMSMDKWRTK